MEHRNARAVLLAGVSILGLAGSARAADTTATGTSPDSREARLKALEQEVQDLSAQIEDLKRSSTSQYAAEQSEKATAVKVKIDNGRPTISSADEKFTASIRALGQLDWGYYSQSKRGSSLPAAYGPDLSSGANFRRVYLGVQGKLFGDWSYNLNFDFGGSGGTEAPGHIQSVYLQYDGLGPFAFRAGAYPAPSNLEDSTSSGDTIFLERNAPSDLQRNIAGGDGRDAVSVLYGGDRLFGALSYTGDKVQETGSVFGEQQAIVGRTSYLVYSDQDVHWLVGANGTYVMHPPGGLARNVAFPATALPNGSARATFALSDPPELTIDENGLKLANTTALSATHVSQWGLETAGTIDSFYGQAGYYDFAVDRGPENFTVFSASATSSPALVTPRNDHFSGWYLQGAFTLTGEPRTYNAATGAFLPPKPEHPFDLETGDWGALELAGRYSDLNLNDHALDASNVVTGWSGTSKTYTYFNTVRGGDQRIATAELNWYPVSAIKFGLQYQYTRISRLQSGSTPSTLIAVGPTASTPALPTLSASQDIQTIALRAQVQF
jgi:phosphate-selective porin OprO/OprP